MADKDARLQPASKTYPEDQLGPDVLLVRQASGA